MRPTYRPSVEELEPRLTLNASQERKAVEEAARGLVERQRAGPLLIRPRPQTLVAQPRPTSSGGRPLQPVLNTSRVPTLRLTALEVDAALVVWAARLEKSWSVGDNKLKDQYAIMGGRSVNVPGVGVLRVPRSSSPDFATAARRMVTVERLTPLQWTVLDNVRRGRVYWLDVPRKPADEAYRWCVRQEFVRDGRITDTGLAALAVGPARR